MDSIDFSRRMKVYYSIATISAVLVNSAYAQPVPSPIADENCVCYGDVNFPGRSRGLKQTVSFPIQHRVLKEEVKEEVVDDKWLLTDHVVEHPLLKNVPVEEFEAAAMRVLARTDRQLQGKGGGKKGDGKKGGGKKGEGKKGKKGDDDGGGVVDDDYMMEPEGDDSLDDLVVEYCACTKVCDDYFECPEEPAEPEGKKGKKEGKGSGKKEGKGSGKKEGKGSGKKGNGGAAAIDEPGSENGSAAGSNSTDSIVVRNLQGKKGGKGGKGGKKGDGDDDGGSELCPDGGGSEETGQGKKGKGGGKKRRFLQGGKKGKKEGAASGKKEGKKGKKGDGGEEPSGEEFCRPVCTCKNYLTFEPTPPETETEPPTTPKPTPFQVETEPPTQPPTTPEPTPKVETGSPVTPPEVSSRPSSPPPVPECIATCVCNDGEKITIEFFNPDPEPEDWIGIYKCKTDPEADYNYHPDVWQWICVDAACDKLEPPQDPPITGTLVFQDPLPPYTAFGPTTWPLLEDQCYVPLLNRNVGRSPPPYDLVCVGEEFRINP